MNRKNPDVWINVFSGTAEASESEIAVSFSLHLPTCKVGFSKLMTKVKKNHRKKSNQMQWENKQMGEIIIREGKKNKEQARSSGLSLWLCAIRHKHHSSRVVGRKPAMGEDNSIKALERLLPFCMPTSTQDGGKCWERGPCWELLSPDTLSSREGMRQWTQTGEDPTEISSVPIAPILGW